MPYRTTRSAAASQEFSDAEPAASLQGGGKGYLAKRAASGSDGLLDVGPLLRGERCLGRRADRLRGAEQDGGALRLLTVGGHAGQAFKGLGDPGRGAGFLVVGQG